MLHNSDRIDIIWDIYRVESLSSFQDFLCDSRNKQELFDFLTDKVSRYDHYPLVKEIYITAGKKLMLHLCC